MSFENLKKGDKVNRMLGGGLLMHPVTVMGHNQGGLIIAAAPGTEHWPLDELWTFDPKTGAEVDEGLEWGPKFGRTGTYLQHDE